MGEEQRAAGPARKAGGIPKGPERSGGAGAWPRLAAGRAGPRERVAHPGFSPGLQPTPARAARRPSRRGLDAAARQPIVTGWTRPARIAGLGRERASASDRAAAGPARRSGTQGRLSEGPPNDWVIDRQCAAQRRDCFNEAMPGSRPPASVALAAPTAAPASAGSADRAASSDALHLRREEPLQSRAESPLSLARRRSEEV